MSEENLKYVKLLNESYIIDVMLLYQFLKRLITPFEKTEAFKLGIIDTNGKFIKKRSELKTQAEKDACGLFDVLVFNLKKLIEKLPFGKSMLMSYAAALYLIREEKNLREEEDLVILEYKFRDFLQQIIGSKKDQGVIEELMEDAAANSVGAGGIAGIGADAEANGIPVPEKIRKKKEEGDMEKAGKARKLSFSELKTKIGLKEDAAHPFKVGDILHCRWGSSMVLHDFYIVQKVSDKGVVIQQLVKVTVGGDGWRPMVQPNGTQVDPREKPMQKRVSTNYRGAYTVKIGDSMGWAELWDGKPHQEDHLD